MAAEITLRKYRQGALIVAMGAPATDVYILVRGKVGISRGPEADPPPHAVLEPGAFFGESALLTGMRYKGFARALTDALCVIIPREKLPELTNMIV